MLIVADTRRSALEKEGTSHADSRCARVFRSQFSRNDVTCPCGTKAKSEKRTNLAGTIEALESPFLRTRRRTWIVFPKNDFKDIVWIFGLHFSYGIVQPLRSNLTNSKFSSLGVKKNRNEITYR